MDLSEVEGARSSVRETVAAFGQVDVVVNAAGTTSRGSMLDTTPEVFDAHIALNLRSSFLVMQEAIAHLRGRGVGGSILHIVTMVQHGGPPIWHHTWRRRRVWPGWSGTRPSPTGGTGSASMD